MWSKKFKSKIIKLKKWGKRAKRMKRICELYEEVKIKTNARKLDLFLYGIIR